VHTPGHHGRASHPFRSIGPLLQADCIIFFREETMNIMSYGLEGKVVVVTGGSRGIGLDLARNFLAQGARVVICGRKETNLAAAQEALGASEHLLAVAAHVAREQDVENLFDRAVDRFGGLDVLVNNVGMNLLTASVTDTDLAVWNKIIEGNLTGAFLCSGKLPA
jgi:NAD(P)-dependent dehydrogenase (short-subunit alcohol dehydrogenase family)